MKTKLIPGKIYENSGMIHFAEINHAPSPYSMLQHIGRVATLKLVPRNCPRYNIDHGGRRIGLTIYVRYCSSHTSSEGGGAKLQLCL